MSLTVLSVAYPLAPVSVHTAGGAEQVLAQLDRALIERGLASLVIAPAGSSTMGDLIPIPAFRGLITPEIERLAQASTRKAIETALQKRRIDLVHVHGIDFHAYLPETTVPVLATLHLPPEWYPPETFTLNIDLNCVSESQQRRCLPGANLLPPIPNGVALNAFRPHHRKRNYALILGRICPEKGIHLALDAARSAGVPVLVAGQVYPYAEHQRYFHEAIEPRLDGRSRRFIGLAKFERKRRLLAGARCVLIPSLVPETSSLVAMEAAACGTPVIAYPLGALTEIVQPGRTGFLVNDVDEMASAIRETGAIDPGHCRAHAERHFDVTRTIDRYIATYGLLTKSRKVRGPRAEVIRSPEMLTATEPEWARLYERSRRAPVFLHPAWQIAWLRAFGSVELHSIALRRSGELVAFATCFVCDGRLVFIGNGVSDRLDLLAADDDAAGAMIRQLRARSLDLQDIPAASPLLNLPHHASSACPVVKLPAAISPMLRRNLRQQLRYLQNEGEVRFETGGDSKCLDDLFALHAARWRHRGQSGLLADSAVQRFHRYAAKGLSEAGLLRSHLLRVNGTAVAVMYGFARNGTMCYYLGGFHPQWEKFSPGSLLIAHAMEYAFLAGDNWFDFLRGREAYKYRWGAQDRQQYQIYT